MSWSVAEKWLVRNLDDPEPNISIFKSFVQSAQLTRNQPGPLMQIAVLCRSTKPLQYLLSMNCHPNAENEKGSTPMHSACFIGNLEMVKLLERYGGDLWCTDYEGNLPLHYSIEGGHKQLIRYIISQPECKLNAENIFHYSPLHIACIEGDKSVIRLLVNAGTRVGPVLEQFICMDDVKKTKILLKCAPKYPTQPQELAKIARLARSKKVVKFLTKHYLN